MSRSISWHRLQFQLSHISNIHSKKDNIPSDYYQRLFQDVTKTPEVRALAQVKYAHCVLLDQRKMNVEPSKLKQFDALKQQGIRSYDQLCVESLDVGVFDMQPAKNVIQDSMMRAEVFCLLGKLSLDMHPGGPKTSTTAKLPSKTFEQCEPNFKKAYAYFLQAIEANENHTGALFQAAQCEIFGYGTQVNSDSAFDHLHKAAQLKNPEAAVLLARYYAFGPDANDRDVSKGRAEILLDSAQELGWVEARIERMFWSGIGLLSADRDVDTAIAGLEALLRDDCSTQFAKLVATTELDTSNKTAVDRITDHLQRDFKCIKLTAAIHLRLARLDQLKHNGVINAEKWAKAKDGDEAAFMKARLQLSNHLGYFDGVASVSHPTVKEDGKKGRRKILDLAKQWHVGAMACKALVGPSNFAHEDSEMDLTPLLLAEKHSIFSHEEAFVCQETAFWSAVVLQELSDDDGEDVDSRIGFLRRAQDLFEHSPLLCAHPCAHPLFKSVQQKLEDLESHDPSLKRARKAFDDYQSSFGVKKKKRGAPDGNHEAPKSKKPRVPEVKHEPEEPKNTGMMPAFESSPSPNSAHQSSSSSSSSNHEPTPMDPTPLSSPPPAAANGWPNGSDQQTVADWLSNLGYGREVLQRIVAVFSANAIGCHDLDNTTDKDLQDIGMSGFHAKQIPRLWTKFRQQT